MPSFTELPIARGDGPWHVNYFRVFLTPRPLPGAARARALPSADQLIRAMPVVMNDHTASVEIDGRHPWAGHPTLQFRGVARVRPFGFSGVVPNPTPFPLPPMVVKFGVPEGLRTTVVPQVHTDSVGVAALRPHSFTALTLKRHFPTGDDGTIRSAIEGNGGAAVDRWLSRIADGLVQPLPGLPLVDPITDWYRRLAHDKVGQLREGLEAGRRELHALADYAVDLNQHHFLAGRRSFRMATVKELGLRQVPVVASGPPIAEDSWVFETAAVERYSAWQFRMATEYVMGGEQHTVRPVWIEMCRLMAKLWGTQQGEVQVAQADFGSRTAVTGSQLYAGVSHRHAALLP